ncbi:MAG: dihydrolipoyl dehydrogenase [Burkholderiaceae bacterium]
MNELSCQLLIIGGGPGGYVCAIRAAQLGLDTIIVEKNKPGGTCLNVGCIPSKALIHAADEYAGLSEYAGGESALGIRVSSPELDLAATMSWKDGIVSRLNNGVGGLLKKSGARLMEGVAQFLDGKTVVVKGAEGQYKIHATNVVIATGSEPVEIPGLPFGGKVISSTEALALNTVPKNLVVVGAGYIGLELGTAYAKLGSVVTVVEAGPSILPQYDNELTAPILKRMQSLGIKLLLNSTASAMAANNNGLQVKNGDDANAQTLAADNVLVAVGRRPVINGWGRDELVLEMDSPFIQVDNKCKTNMRGIYAIGDVTGEPMLAHRAMAQGEMVAEIVAGHKRQWDKACIPAVCFTDPELVTAGQTAAEASDQGVEVVIGKFAFRGNGRAMTTEREDGFIRVVARADNHLVIGVQGVGVGISELSATMSMAIEMGARLEDIADTIHAHPTRSEAFAEAAMTALGRGLHS